MRAVFGHIERYAPSAAPVLVTGPTGTGKELVARALHHHSGKRGRFVAVNCASVTDSLFESEFFGHKRGSFTGALFDRKGWFEQAAGGTLFLDEVGEMPLSQQAKLLRAIQERSVIPVGSTQPVPVSARIVAATNADVMQAVESNRFREDLRDRLNVLSIRMPALPDRPGDFPLLLEHFVGQANTEEGTDVQVPRGEALDALERGFGRGSIRVLENAVRRIVLAKRQGRVAIEDLCKEGIVSYCGASAAVESSVRFPENSDSMEVTVRVKCRTPLKAIMRSVKKTVLNTALRRHHGHVAPAMQELQVTKGIWYRIRGG
jgi:DNA-binding NtrC family response regulator